MTNVPKERTVEEIKSFSELLDSVQVGDTVTGFLRADLLETLHQELQKAREEERERILALAEDVEIFTAFGYDTTSVKMIDPAKIINNKTNGF